MPFTGDLEHRCLRSPHKTIQIPYTPYNPTPPVFLIRHTNTQRETDDTAMAKAPTGNEEFTDQRNGEFTDRRLPHSRKLLVEC